MITREDMKKDLAQACAEYPDVSTRQLAVMTLILEVLFDIRDLLQQPHSKIELRDINLKP